MSDSIEYLVMVHRNGNKCWRLNGSIHREDGPAVEYVDGRNWWYLDGEQYTEAGHTAEMLKRNNPPSGMTLTINDKTYTLTEVKDD